MWIIFVCKRIYCECAAKLVKINKRHYLLQVLKILKFSSSYATIITENIRQYVKSIVHDTRNRVNDGMKCVSKGLWHEDCIIHYRNTAETAFLALLHTVWYKKRCFCDQTQRSE